MDCSRGEGDFIEIPLSLGRFAVLGGHRSIMGRILSELYALLGLATLIGYVLTRFLGALE